MWKTRYFIKFDQDKKVYVRKWITYFIPQIFPPNNFIPHIFFLKIFIPLQIYSGRVPGIKNVHPLKTLNPNLAHLELKSFAPKFLSKFLVQKEQT